MRRWGALALGGITLATWATDARADEPIELFKTWGGSVDFFATGAPLAIDGPDSDSSVDVSAQPATATVTASDVPADAEVREAYLYWGGSITDTDCDGTQIDDTVQFTEPNGTTTDVVADECWCSTAGATSYDMQMCRAEVTPQAHDMVGDYTVSGFEGLLGNQSTTNASFSIVLVYQLGSLPPRRIGLYDGLQTMWSSTTSSLTVTLDEVEVNDPARGDLTWYVLEGDVGGSSGEGVQVRGVPGGGAMVPSDALNPADNPMNSTINTTSPVQPVATGVDVDQFSIDAALTPGDSAVDVTYLASMDKWWIAYNIVGVDVYEAVLGDSSSKSWVLQDDANGDGEPSSGDTLRYTIHIENTGNTAGVASVVDPLDMDFIASFSMVDAGGGTDHSDDTTIVVDGLALGVGESVDVMFDVLLEGPEGGGVLANLAELTVEPGTTSAVLAPAAKIDGGGPDAGSTDGGGADGDGADDDGDGSGAGEDDGGDGMGDTGHGTDVGDDGAEDTAAADGGLTGVGLGRWDREGTGCGCSSQRSPGPTWALMCLLLGLRPRRATRRSHRRRSTRPRDR